MQCSPICVDKQRSTTIESTNKSDNETAIKKTNKALSKSLTSIEKLPAFPTKAPAAKERTKSADS